jgi:hypothetical protein
MEIFAKSTLPMPLLTITRQSGDADLSFLKPGQLYSALVQSNTANGILSLSINDNILKVVSELQLTQGTTINVKVEVNEGVLVLRLLTPQSGASVTQETAQQALRQFLPKQQPLQPLFAQLARLAMPLQNGAASGTGNTLSADLKLLPPQVRQAISSLLKQLPNNEKVTTPEGLKQALNNSGMFFENRLQQGEGKASLQGDLKTLLFRIAFLVRQSLESLPAIPTVATRPPATPGEGKTPPSAKSRGGAGTPQNVAAEKLAATTSLLQLLGRQSESALARVQVNQLTCLHSQQQGEEPLLTLELPLFNGRESEVIQLKIQRETKQNGGEAESCWSVTLRLDSENYGAIRAVVSLAGGKVSTTFWCEQPQTQLHFQQHLEELRQRMQQQGLELGRTQAFAGQPPEQQAPDTPHANDNLINTRA